MDATVYLFVWRKMDEMKTWNALRKWENDKFVCINCKSRVVCLGLWFYGFLKCVKITHLTESWKNAIFLPFYNGKSWEKKANPTGRFVYVWLGRCFVRTETEMIQEMTWAKI